MKLTERLKRIASARLCDFVDSAEDPGEVLPRLVKEMRDLMRVSGEGEAKARAAARSARRKHDEVVGRIARLERGALMALEKGEEDLAREAVRKQVSLEKELEKREAEVARAEKALDDLMNARLLVSSQFEKLKAREKDIVSRGRAAAEQKRSFKNHASASSILDEAVRMERKLDMHEAEVDGSIERSKMAELSVEERLRRLEKDAEIDKRLAVISRRSTKT